MMEQQLHAEDVYVIGKEIGVGAYSFVHTATHKESNKEYAIKIIDKKLLSSKERDRLQQEVDVLRDCRHPNILSLVDTFETRTRFYVVMELLPGGDLFDRIVQKKKYSENEARFVLFNILKAIAYLHQKGYVHRDLKPENMLLTHKDDHTSVKLADFGFAEKIKEGEYLTTPCGSPGYVAPEIANQQAYTKSADMWSIGVIMYTMLAGFPPFYDEDDYILLEKVSEGKFSFPNPYWKENSEEAKDLIRKLLEKDTSLRYTAQQACDHPWFMGLNGNNANTNQSSSNSISNSTDKQNKYVKKNNNTETSHRSKSPSQDNNPNPVSNPRTLRRTRSPESLEMNLLGLHEKL